MHPSEDSIMINKDRVISLVYPGLRRTFRFLVLYGLVEDMGKIQLTISLGVKACELGISTWSSLEIMHVNFIRGYHW